MKNNYIAFNIRNTSVLALALSTLSAIIIFSYLNLNDIKNLTAHRVSVQETLTKLEIHRTALNAAENRQRGFIMTGENSYLEHYKQTLPTIRSNLQALIADTQNDKPIQQKVLKLQSLFEEQADNLNKAIYIKQNNGLSAAIKFVKTTRGKYLMDESENLLNSMKNVELQYLQIATEKRTRALHRGSQMIMAGSATAILLIIVAAVLLNNELRQRKSREISARASEMRLEKERRRLSQIISTQYDISIAERDEESLMNLVVQRIALLASCEGAWIEEISGTEFICRAIYGPASNKLQPPMKINISLAKRCREENQTIRCDNVQTDARVNSADCVAMGMASMVAVPLKYLDQFQGVLTIYSNRPEAFSDDDISTLQLMAGLMGSAMNYIRTFKAQQEAEKKALESSKMKSQFLANMSHEIRTPINGVLGMADLLSETKLSIEQKDFTDSIQRSAESLLVIVNDVLDLSKIEAGKLDIEILSFDLDSVISDIGKTFSKLAQKKGVGFSIINPVQQSHFLLGDPGRLRQILSNLISNAIKFTHSGRIVLRIISTMITTHTVQLKFEVEDTGIGIPEDKQDRLFQAFSQVDASTVRRYGGTGLGLSICKNLVTLMNGSINFSSKSGQGSIFWFSLPFELGAELKIVQPEAYAPPISQPAVQARILIAEDNFINQKVALSIIEKLGHRGLGVTNGLEVLEALKQSTYDLVLMDCQMPELDGYEATKRIRSLSNVHYSEIPIIALTANAIKGDRDRCLESGMNDYLTKPIRMTDLGEMLTKYLPKATAINTSSIDPKRIETLMELENDEGKSILNDLVPIFLKEAPLKIAAMKAFCETKNMKGLKFEAHRLKSTGANMGLNQFADLCASLEYHDDTLGASEIKASIDQLAQEFLVASKELQALVENINKQKAS